MLKYVEITCLFCFVSGSAQVTGALSAATSRRLNSRSDPSKFLLHVELALNKEMRRRGRETAQVHKTALRTPCTTDRRQTAGNEGKKTNVQRAGHPREEKERQRYDGRSRKEIWRQREGEYRYGGYPLLKLTASRTPQITQPNTSHRTQPPALALLDPVPWATSNQVKLATHNTLDKLDNA